MSKSLTEIGREFVVHSGMEGEANDDGSVVVISPRTLLERAQHELLEAYAEAWAWGEDAKDSMRCEAYLEECADIVLTLAAGLAAQGFDLQAEVERKHAVNLKRNWEPHPSIPGAVKRRILAGPVDVTFTLPPKKEPRVVEGWVSVYKDDTMLQDFGRVFATKAGAQAYSPQSGGCIGTFKVRFVEGEGDE